VLKLQMWIIDPFSQYRTITMCPLTEQSSVFWMSWSFSYFRLISHSDVMIIFAYHIISLIKVCILPTMYIYRFNVITKWKVIILLHSINSLTFEMEIKCFIWSRNGIFTHTHIYPSVTLEFKLKLLPRTEGFQIYSTLQCIHKSKVH